MTTGSLRGDFIKCLRLGVQINLLLLIWSIADLIGSEPSTFYGGQLRDKWLKVIESDGRGLSIKILRLYE